MTIVDNFVTISEETTYIGSGEMNYGTHTVQKFPGVGGQKEWTDQQYMVLAVVSSRGRNTFCVEARLGQLSA